MTIKKQYRSKIAARLRAARKEQKVSQEALAKGCGVAKSTISRVELGETAASAELVLLMCHRLGLDPRSVFGGLK